MEYMKSVPDGFFDLAIVDPPYGDCGGKSRAAHKLVGGGTKKYVNPDGSKFTDWDIAPSRDYFDELFRCSKSQIIWGGNYFSLPPTRCFVVWKKLGIPENFTYAQAEYAWCSFDSSAKVYEERPMSGGRIHVCQKPVGLYGFLLRHFAKPGDRILDTHMGSQSSRIACYEAGYDYWGCEINETYYRQGCARFDAECRGIEIINGHRVVQMSLFANE